VKYWGGLSSVIRSFNPHFQRLFTATPCLPARWYPTSTFNPHFQRLFTATGGEGPAQRGTAQLSILIFRGSLLLQDTIRDMLYFLKNFQSSFSEALYCYYRYCNCLS